MSVTPSFWVLQLCWLEQGGIFAIASIRGGGEYGEAWHRTARLSANANKPAPMT